MQTTQKEEHSVLQLARHRVGPFGIVAMKLPYDSPDLQEALERYGAHLTVVVYVDPSNIHSVLAGLPNCSMLKLDLQGDKTLVPRTLGELRKLHKAAGAQPRNELRRRHDGSPGIPLPRGVRRRDPKKGGRT